MISLTDTAADGIATEFIRARRHAGSPAMSMVMTLVVIADEHEAEEAMKAAQLASHEHPARVLGIILGGRRGASQVDADVGVGHGWTGETALIRLSGEVAAHPESVVVPLLLPDSPVVVWWPSRAPQHPGEDPLGRLARRRITDTAAAPRGRSKALHVQCEAYTPGNTDFAWTRITGWRALLAAALDQHPVKVTGADVTAERGSPSAELLAAWLADRLRIDVDRRTSAGPGITGVVLHTASGDISLTRSDGRHATLSTPGQPDRPVALHRREVPELLAEELRHLDPDEVYAATVRKVTALRAHSDGGSGRGAKRTSRKRREQPQ